MTIYEFQIGVTSVLWGGDVSFFRIWAGHTHIWERLSALGFWGE